jgi:hypothetical protein
LVAEIARLFASILPKHSVTFQFGRDCVNQRYSFKPSDGFIVWPGKFKQAQALQLAEYRKLVKIAGTCPVDVQVSESLRRNLYCNLPQLNNAVRFKDI